MLRKISKRELIKASMQVANIIYGYSDEEIAWIISKSKQILNEEPTSAEKSIPQHV